jgi:hypothetical protein
MKKEDITLLKELHNKYAEAHDELNTLSLMLEKIEERRQVIRQILDDTRESEKALINKLEKDLGKTLSVEALIEIINMNEF